MTAQRPMAPDPAAAWEALAAGTLDRRHLARHRVISLGRLDPAHVAFDVLRTRLLQLLREKGWSRVGITSPTKGCGKTFVAANLALSLARTGTCRTLLMDLDLRLPSLAAVLGLRPPGALRAVLAGEVEALRHLQRAVPGLAVGLNARRVRNAAELLQNPSTAAALARIRAALAPDVELYDLPPMLATDDVIAFLPQLDGLLLVAGGGITRADEIQKCERLLGSTTPLIGVVLNRADDPDPERYQYG